ncbi:MAG: type 4a pilus biogenesis protein PilO [Candidatus Paceibacterota bacterium]|jgi:Tfp pilus assembly protein PilO
MFQFITPIILVAVSVGTFFFFTNPLLTEVKDLRVKQSDLNEGLNNSQKLIEKRDSLLSQYNSFSPDSLKRLKNLLPDNVDNIRLIIEIEQMAAKYGMQLTNVKFDVIPKGITQAESTTTGGNNKDYGTFNLEFSTQGSYANFNSFLGDLEKSLRIVDINSLSFTASETASAAASGIYKYDMKIKTYWLKG